MQKIADSLDFFESITGEQVQQANRVEFYTSHEGLHLLYEQAQTRFLQHRERWYNLTTHYPWIGMRTADPDGAHIEYFRGIANPLGVKVGDGMSTDTLRRIVAALNPDREPGRLTLIHRFGAGNVEARLPKMIDAVAEMETPVLWMCDPMHGNTVTTTGGIKTRRFDAILAELEASFRIHESKGTILGGVHLELTGDHVTECIGGARGLGEEELSQAYMTQVDPRLNYEQAMEVALVIAGRRSDELTERNRGLSGRDDSAVRAFDPNCRRCPRLAGFLDDIRVRYPDYHARPVPSFGAADARLLIVGLAPGLHGANATGRPFTGDFAGILLYETLHACGFASRPESRSADDGLVLDDCRITNAVRCLPPQNKPTTGEVDACNPYLAAEIGRLPERAVILALGTIAHRAVLRSQGLKLSAHRFAHGARHVLCNRRLLLDSYHCSRYNTQTRRLTGDMFRAVFDSARAYLAAQPG